MPTASRAQGDDRGAPFFDVSINADYGAYHPVKTSYLGTQIGAGPNVFDFVRAGGEQTYSSKGISIAYRPAAALNDYVFQFGFSDFKSYQSERFGTLDTLGQNLLIPGVGVGPSGVGFALAGPNNQITDGAFKSTLNGYDFNIAIKRPISMFNKRLRVSPMFGMQYKKLRSQNTFDGNIPFFTRRFGYDTKLNVESFSPSLGVDLEYRMNDGLALFGCAQYAYDFNHGKGYDSLAFTGFDRQSLNLNNDAQTQSQKAHIGVRYRLNPAMSLSLQGNYQSAGNTPILDVRTSVASAEFSYKKSKIYSAGLKLAYRF